MPVLSKLGRIVFTALPNGYDEKGRPRLSVYMHPQLATDADLGDYDQQVIRPLIAPGDALKAFRLTWRSNDGAALGSPIVIPAPVQRIDGLFWAVFSKGDVCVKAIDYPDAPNPNAAAAPGPAKPEVRSFPALDIADSLRNVAASYAAMVLPPRPPNVAFAAAAAPAGPEQGDRVELVPLPSRDDVLAKSRGIAFRDTQRLSPAERTRRQKQIEKEFKSTPGLKEYLKALADDPVADLNLHTIHAAREVLRSGRSSAGEPAPLKPAAAAALAPEPNPENTFRAGAFLQFAAFHGAPKADVIPLAAASSAAECKLDFHDYLNMLRGHPLLLRALGLVFDLSVPEPPASAELVEVGPADAVPGLKFVLCRTFFDWNVAGRRFQPRPKDSLFKEGFLDLSDSARFRLESLDFAGGAFKALQQAEALAPSRVSGNGGDADRLSVPSLRSAGVSLIWRGRREHVQSRLLEATEDERRTPTLYAEDVTVAYRPDIHEAVTNSWHSLCQRDQQESKYTFPGLQRTLRLSELPGDAASHEGAVHLTVTRPDGAQEYHAHEAIFRWDGWSVAAPSPLDRALEREPQKEDLPLGFLVEFKAAPFSLPRLRFDTIYRMRCRTVDLAGNGRAASECDADRGFESSPLHFKRYEPLAAPVILLAERLDPKKSPGEQLDRLVIRSGRDSNSDSGRYVVPARVSFKFAELHGVFDREEQLPASAFPDAHLMADGSFPIHGPRDEGDPAKQNAYLEYGATGRFARPDCPYYPDPIALRARITIVKGEHRGLSMVHRFYEGSDWPDAQPFRVDLRPAKDGKFSWGWQRLPVGGGAALTGRTVSALTVELPEAEILELNVSSDLHTTPLESMALWDEVLVKTPADQHDALESAARAGQHWLFTPPRKLTLVHAVRRPLEAPKLAAAVLRQADNTEATLSGNLRIHGKSTGRVDLLLSWKDPVDDPLTACWQWAHHAHVLQLPLKPRQDEAKDVLAPADDSRVEVDHDFADTKHHRLQCQTNAASAFTDYFKPQPSAPRCGADADFSTCGDTFELLAPSTVRPDPPLLDYVMPTFAWEPISGGRVRLGGGLRIWLRRPWFSSGEGERLAVLLWPCLETGGALPESKLSKDLPDGVTAWGADPLWASAPVAGRFPTASDFKGVDGGSDSTGPVFVQGLTLRTTPTGAPPSRVDVVAYRPEFDGSRRMWYCDVEFAPAASYFAFVRLALARYQRHALTDLHLSPVVVADFAQLAPDRWATVRRSVTDKHAVELQVRGVAPQSSCAWPSSNALHVLLEENTREEDELNWVPSLDEAGKEISHVVHARAEGSEALWRAIIALPKKHRGRRYRLALREFEVYEADVDDPTARREQDRAFVSRLVYVEILPVPR